MSDFSKIPYGLFKDDYRGFRHSIDKLIIDYELVFHSFSVFVDLFVSRSSFSLVRDRGEDGYNCFFDRPPSSTYGWFRDAFWFAHVNVKHGLYYRHVFGKDRHAVWDEKNIVRVEFNPNKCSDSSLWLHLLYCISFCCKCGYLIECDYSVDVPLPTKSIHCSSRASLICYEDSRYYGKRHKNGRIKIYNKAKELRDKDKVNINEIVSRCELTCREGEKLIFHDIRSFSNPDSLSCLSKNLRSIADLILYSSAFGEDAQTLINRFVPDKRNRDKLFSVFLGRDSEDILCSEIFIDLLKQYSTRFGFWFYFLGSSEGEVFTFNCPFSSVSEFTKNR